jgi:hypothetical protein
MEKHLMIILVGFSFICYSLSGCEQAAVKSNVNSLVGTWVTDSIYDTLRLDSDGRCMKFTYEGTWSIEEDRLTLVYTVHSRPYTYAYDYYFSDFNNTLTLTSVDSGYSITYTRR